MRLVLESAREWDEKLFFHPEIERGPAEVLGEIRALYEGVRGLYEQVPGKCEVLWDLENLLGGLSENLVVEVGEVVAPPGEAAR